MKLTDQQILALILILKDSLKLNVFMGIHIEEREELLEQIYKQQSEEIK